MQRRAGFWVVAATFAAALLLPGVAAAATKVVFAGTPPATKALAIKLLGKGAKALGQDNPEINAFSNQTVTIHQGDAVKWVGLAANFHTVDLPTKGGKDLPLFVPGSTATGVNDAAGSPFWFNGHPQPRLQRAAVRAERRQDLQRCAPDRLRPAALGPLPQHAEGHVQQAGRVPILL